MAHEKPPSDQPDEDPVPDERPAAPHAAQGNAATGRASERSSGNEEPEFALEPDVPTDGRDEVGEDMIRMLPKQPGLSDPPPEAGSRK